MSVRNAEKNRRFRITRLEERIVPGPMMGGGGHSRHSQDTNGSHKSKPSHKSKESRNSKGSHRSR